MEAGGLGDAIKNAFADRPEYEEILVTGHSLGGALASIAALELRQSSVYYNLSIAKVNVVTFGSPRWCNQALAAFYNNVIDTNWRIVNRYDIAVTVPLKEMGYVHVGTQIWYRWQRWWWNEDPLSYKICDGSGEDPNCFGTELWLDRLAMPHHHTNYFELDRKRMCIESRRRLISDSRLLE